MPIYTDTPSSFNNVIINRNGNTVTVKTGGLDFCWIAVTSGDMGKKYFMVKCEAKDSSVFENVPDDYTVCITLGDFYKLKFCHSDIYMYICIVKQE